MKKPTTKLEYQFTAQQIYEARPMAKKAGITPTELLHRQARERLKDLPEGPDLSPKQAAWLLGNSAYTVRRYVTEGRFPGAMLQSARAIRIPRADVEKLKKSRLLRVD